MPKTVYLQPEELVKHSRHHRHYMGDGNMEEGKDGRRSPLKVVEFFNGVARNVDEQAFKQAKDEGIADTKRPSIGNDSDY